MFGRRRRPLLATAVVVGASRSAARREVGRATAGQAQYEQDVEQEAERKRREEEGQEARTQRAVDEALKRAGVAGYAADQQPSTASSSTQPVQQRQSAQAGALPVSVTPQNSPTKPEFQPHPQTLAPVGPQGGDALRTPTPMSLGEEGAIQYCPACGNACQMEDMFCRKCGRKQVRG